MTATGNNLQYIAENYSRVLDTASEALSRSDRQQSDLTIMAVTKNVDCAHIEAAYHAGIHHMAENRVQEAQTKIPHSQNEIKWHMIGHLQRNKVQSAISVFRTIESVDSIRLAKSINKHASPNYPIMLQVNASNNPSQYGVNPDELPDLCGMILEKTSLNIDGLMAIAPMTNNESRLRSCFKQLRHLRENLLRQYPDASLSHLSMGMTEDYPIAIEEGATIVRIGRAIFKG
tara:strand:- start:67 stop:759 length:693 start_codon:yes stop_codon:yes gene_type:complete